MRREIVRAAVAKRAVHAQFSSTEIHRGYVFPSVAKFAADRDSRILVKRSLFRIQFFGWQPTRHWTNPFGELEIAALSVAVPQAVKVRQSCFR